MDYGKRAPDLGWRVTDAWLSMAGAGSKGLHSGVSIDEWGVRMEAGSCNPAGASVARGGGTNGPAAVPSRSLLEREAQGRDHRPR
jgi:glycerol transport system substrate-binding protein